MVVTEQATRITIFLSEDDRAGKHALHEALMQRARAEGMAGATVWRAVEGFGPSGRIRTSRFPDAGTGLPVAIELVDTDDRIESFLSVVHELAPRSFVTRDEVRTIRFAAPAMVEPATGSAPTPPATQLVGPGRDWPGAARRRSGR